MNRAFPIYLLHLKKVLLLLIDFRLFVTVVASLLFVLSLVTVIGNASANYYLGSQFNALEGLNSLYYDIAVERERADDASQQFFATNNEVKQVYNSVFEPVPEELGQAVAITADGNRIAVSVTDENGLLTVYIIGKNSSQQWQTYYSFSYESFSSTNYAIPSTDTPADSDDLLFGRSLAFYGNKLLAIGAPGWQGPAVEDDTSTTDVYEGDNGTNRGAVYIFHLQNETWVLLSTLRGLDPQAHFGSSVHFSSTGNLLVGAKGGAYDTCPNAPADQILVPANEDVDDDGDIDEDDTKEADYINVACPSVYIYERGSQDSSQWDKTDTISVNIAPNRLFGSSVAFANNNLIAVGAPGQLAPNRVAGEDYTRRPGAVHLYAKDSDGNWEEELVISDFNTDDPGSGKYQIELEDLDAFGQAVDFLDNDTLVIAGRYKGILYILQKSNDGWEQIGTIEGSQLLAGDPLPTNEDGYASNFGQAISISSNTIVVTNTNDEGVVNLLDWTTFHPDASWHYAYIDNGNCGADDFLNNPTSYNEGELITPPKNQEGSRLCFKVDNGFAGVEYFASEIIDLSAPQFTTPALDISENGVLSIYFDEKIRQIENEEIDEDWVRANVGTLSITLHGQTIPLSIPLNHNNAGSTINSGNSLISISHPNEQTVLRVQVDTANANFPPTTAPSSSAPHAYAIALKNFEDSVNNAQLTDLTAEATITKYVHATPIIMITAGTNQDVSVTDNLAAGASTLVYVWLNQDSPCDGTTAFNSVNSYTEGASISLEENHNGQQICFRATNNNDTDLMNYKAYQVDNIDRSAPVVAVNLTKTSISATDNEENASTWVYVVLDSRTCDNTTDFSSATAYIEDTNLPVDPTDSAQVNKYYCFRSTDNQDNIGYQSSSQIGGSPSIQKITLGGGNGNLFGIGKNLMVQFHFDEPVTVIGGERALYLHLNSQPGPNNLNAFWEDTSDLANGIVSFRYVPLRNDSASDLQIVDILLSRDAAIRDADGNDAILDLSGLVFVDDNGQTRTIEIDGFKPTIALTWPDFTTWTETKVVSATDDESGNESDTYWDYHFINAEEANVNPYGYNLEIRCYLGDFLPLEEEGTPYTEGDEITLTEENNGHYICFRSRRVKPEFWDILNRDRGGRVSNLIQGIDSSPPTISFNIGNGRVTPVVTDLLSGVQADSLDYKLIEADAECDEATFNGDETDYTSGVSIEVLIDYYGSRFCFTASDNLGNAAYEKTDILSAPSRPRRDNTPPNIIVTNPDDSNPDRFKTVSAVSDSDDVDDSSWHWKIYDPENDDCNAELMASGTTVYQPGAAISLDSEAHNGQSICFSVSDDEDNEAFTASAVIDGIDRQAPTITVSLVDEYAIAVDDDNDVTSWEYQIIPANTVCNEEALNTPLPYIEARAVSLAGFENHKACFKVTDQAGNTSFAASAVFLTRAAAEQTEDQTETDDDDEEDDEEDKTITPGGDTGVSNKIINEIDDGSTAGDNFYLWWLLLSLAIFFVVLFIITKKRRDEEDA